jgi:hypothetical protein
MTRQTDLKAIDPQWLDLDILYLIMDGRGDKVSLELEGRTLPEDGGDLARVDLAAVHLGDEPRWRYEDGVEGAEAHPPLVRGLGCDVDIFDGAARCDVRQYVLFDRPRPEPILLRLTCRSKGWRPRYLVVNYNFLNIF